MVRAKEVAALVPGTDLGRTRKNALEEVERAEVQKSVSCQITDQMSPHCSGISVCWAYSVVIASWDKTCRFCRLPVVRPQSYGSRIPKEHPKA